MSRTQLRSFRSICSSFLFCIALSSTVIAQSGSGVITGVVRDASGAFVPGADIVLTERSTGIKHSYVTTEAGTYRTSPLSAGDYRVSAALSGFKTAVAHPR